MIQETELIATVTSILEKELTVSLGMSLPLFQLEARQKQEKDKLRVQMSSKRQEIEKKRRLIRGLYENFVQGVLTSEECAAVNTRVLSVLMATAKARMGVWSRTKKLLEMSV